MIGSANEEMGYYVADKLKNVTPNFQKARENVHATSLNYTFSMVPKLSPLLIAGKSWRYHQRPLKPALFNVQRMPYGKTTK